MSAAPVPIMGAAGKPAQVRVVGDILTLPSVWDMNATVEWLVDDMIPRASVNLISAESGTGKTWLAYAIAGAVAHGAAFIGRTVRQAPVLCKRTANPY